MNTNHFDVLKEMMLRKGDIELYGHKNIKSLDLVKGEATVLFRVSPKVLRKVLADVPQVLVFIVADQEEFLKIDEELGGE